ncbi:helix-turn-helix domain-containing protein [Candidatus Methylobacter oryzae]|uniref:ImmA/IrrE family metallo-endopeptidase n=1 Tax=Candidatus Methylobacter oryzae TaxID=2497749 RepID=A0ABY3C5F6_9GAMM|nr:XRE family transcriptional regulator [Candidatus Methylobacter oryzae]TRW90248.1 ImmA/IrrE family metallo-endopeptidase [Candidatus Methylobacter oryzae]
MERIQSINPERIAWCCADHGITPGDLASELNIARASIERVMAGEDGITFNQLRKIAEYFGRGVLFFLEPGPVNETQVHTAQFRTLANQKPELSAKLKALIERVEKQREVYLNLCENLSNTDKTEFNPPKLHGKNQQEAARIAREWLGLNDRNTFDSYREAVEARGILVFRSNGHSGKWQIAKENPILGFSLFYPTCPVIVIKKQDWEPQQSFTLMHELGHLLLHKTSSIDDEQDLHSHQGKEQAANAFAGHLLVPDTFLTNIRDEERPDEVSQYDEWLERPRKTWGVSGEVILRRLLDAGRLPQDRYTAYRQWKKRMPIQQKDGGNRQYRHREPKHIFGDTFVRTVLDALDARYITLAKASSYLDNLKINDLHQLERHIAGF